MAGATVNTTVVQGALTAVATPARFTGTRTFYSAATSGGSPTTLNTVVVTGGYINSWTQSAAGAGVPGEWVFSDAVNSGQILTIGF